MTADEVRALAKVLAPIVTQQIGEAVGPLLRRLDAAETQLRTLEAAKETAAARDFETMTQALEAAQRGEAE